MLEYALPWHDATIQERGFMETSCYVHLLRNGVHETLDYIGITQYDMIWTAEAAALVRQLAGASGIAEPTVFGVYAFPFVDVNGAYHWSAFPEDNNFAAVLQSYNRFFGRSHDLSVLVNRPLCLFQTFLMPRQQFAEMAAWLAVLCDEIYAETNRPPYGQHWGVMAGRTERAEAIYIAAQLAEGRIKLLPLPLMHDLSIADKLQVGKAH
jgi:hypothetical protein